MNTELEKFQDNVKGMMAETMPVDEAGLKAEWQRIGDENGVDVKAADSHNPFWRIISELITTPFLWLQVFIQQQIMPNMFLKFAGGEWLEYKAESMGVEKQTAIKSQVMISFIRVDSTAVLEVPANTEVHSAEINGVVYKLKSVMVSQFNIGELEIEILCEAAEVGAAYNLDIGYYQVLPNAIDGVVAITNKESSLVVGRDDETDDKLRTRTRDKWSNQYNWHVDSVYRSIVASFEGVNSDDIWFDRTSPRGENSADVILLFDVGMPTQAFIDNINSEIQSKELFGLGDDVLVKGITRIPQDIVCDYAIKDGLTVAQQTQLELDIPNFINAAFREHSGAGWSVTRTQPYDIFSFGLLTHEIFNQFVGQLKNIRFTNSDITSELDVASINTLTVTKL